LETAERAESDGLEYTMHALEGWKQDLMSLKRAKAEPPADPRFAQEQNSFELKALDQRTSVAKTSHSHGKK